MKVRKIKTCSGTISFPVGIPVQNVKHYVERAKLDSDMLSSMVNAIKK